MASNRKVLVGIIACLAVVLAVLAGIAFGVIPNNDPIAGSQPPETQSTTETTGTQSTTQATEPTTEPTESTTEPSEPPVYKVSTATVASVGDFLMHLPVIESADIQDGFYDFANMFTYFGDYVAAADYAVGNLETTLAGADYTFWYNGEKYVGYHGFPVFNCPDSFVNSVQAAGFDMLLTANNHSYDSRNHGFNRTQQIIEQLDMDYLGTFASRDQDFWQIVECNGIRIGMICYTYETDDDPEKKALNGTPMSSECAARVATFSYGQLETFYIEMAEQIAEMEAAGAEAIVLYIHWGDEYQRKQNATQSAMAQKLCDLGVDVIVGGHPHVVQPVQLLTSTTDETHKTVCVYSLGNIVSNQRRHLMNLKTGHTEDGAMFSFTFAKYSDGTVILENVNLLPTWVDLHTDPETGRNVYTILPLDKSVADWQSAFALDASRLAKAEESYNRTIAIMGAGVEQVQLYLAQLVADTEAALGITE